MAADTQLIKDRIDIAQLIGEYVTLKKAGANWKANCPFHNEKSPSFMVHSDKQIWHCFGCGKGGDIFTFIQEMEGLEFVEALKLLAKRAGVEIDTHKSEVNQSLRNRLLEINAAAAYFFHHFLLELPAAEIAREYLVRRELKKETLVDWQIGYSADQWELLTKYLIKKGFTYEDIVASGLAIKRDGADVASGRGFYDRFRGRVMFPISDVHGNCVGFTGRVLVETENSGGKYVNTPQTLLYDKSRVLYGLHKAKIEIKAKDLVVLVEGQMDVVACHQAGMKNVVAASGTALTLEQIKLIKRYTNNIAMAFDADAAGENAGKRGIDKALEAGMQIKVIQIPAGAGKDADECLKKNPAIWFQAVNDAKGIMDWYFSVTLRNIDLNNFQQKQKSSTILITEIARLPQLVERDEWIKKLSDTLRVDLQVLREEAKKITRVGAAQKPKPEVAIPVVAPIKLPTTPLERISNELWSLLIKFPEHFGTLHPELKPAYFKGTTYESLYETATSVYTSDNKVTLERLQVIYHPIDGSPTIDILLLRPYRDLETLNTIEAKNELQQLVHRMKEEWRKKRGSEIQQALALAERTKDQEQVSNLLSELQALQ
jgi:DNA primase